MSRRRARRGRGCEVGHDRKGLVVHHDHGGRILRDVPIPGHHHRHRLARITDLVEGERSLSPWCGQPVVRDQQRERLPEVAFEVRVSEHAEDTWQCGGSRHVDAPDAGVREVRADERGLRGAMFEVVRVAASARQQTRVLHARDGLAEHPRGHRSSSIAAGPPRDASVET